MVNHMFDYFNLFQPLFNLFQNKDRLPEDRLVCLAQTFANIEFMGCRFESDTSKDSD